MRVIAVANHKGGVGKTATAHALGAILAEVGQRVLLVDIDPQGSLTAACGIHAEGESLAEVLTGERSAQDVIQGISENLYLLPGDIALANTELNLIQRMSREHILKNALSRLDFDLCFIDCPPSLSLLAVNALTAATDVLIPTQPQIADLRGLGLFLQSVRDIQDAVNPNLNMLGIVITFYDTRLGHHAEALQMMKDTGLPVLNSKIGRSVKVAEAMGTGQSVVTYEPDNKQAAAYVELAKELFING